MGSTQKNRHLKWLVTRLALGTAAIATVSGAPAWAQDNGPQEDAAPPRADAATVGDDGVIIVTARRRNEALQDTPVAITAIQAGQLEAKGTLNIGDLQGTAPNLLITQQPTGASAANISIRGIAFADVEKSFDPSVGIYVDGVYIGTSTGQYLDFFDIDSIEVLRGPQGTLFGRNTIAGVINIRRSRPTMEWGGKFEASAGSYGAFGLRGVLNVPIIDDVLGVKLFQFHQQTDGFQHDVATGARLGRTNNENYGAAIRFRPSDSFDAILTLEKQEQDFDSYFASITQPGDVFCGYLPSGACGGNLYGDDIHKVYRGSESTGFYSAKAATLEMTLDTGPIELTSVTSYRKSKDGLLFDIGSTGLYIADRYQPYEQFSQELRAAGKLSDAFDYVAGLYYFRSEYALYQTTTVFGSFAGNQITEGIAKSYAAFVDFNWNIFDNVRLSGGGRYTEDRKAYSNPLLYSGPAKQKWSKFTPKLTLDWRPNEDVMLYGTWSRGYRSGGFNGRGLTAYSARTPYDPESVDSFEVGVKTDLFDRRLSFNLAGFYTDYKDIQQSSTITLEGGQGNETIVTNAAGAKIKGFEADLTARLFEGFTLRGALGYTDAKFKGFIVNQPVTLADATIVTRAFDYSAVDPVFAPKWTLSVNGDYEIPVGEATVMLSAGYRYLSPYDQQIAPDPALYPALLADPAGTSTVIVPRNDPRVRSDPQNLVDASIAVTFPMNQSGAKARLSAFVRNVLDDRGPSFAFTVAAYPALWAYSVPREPRVFGVSAGIEF